MAGHDEAMDQPPSSAASRSASAMSSMVLALKNGSSGVVGQLTVAQTITRGPAVDLADVFHHQRVAKFFAQCHAPQAYHRMRLSAGSRDRELRFLFGAGAHAAGRPDRAAGTDNPPRRSAPTRHRAGLRPPSRAPPGCRPAVPGKFFTVSGITGRPKPAKRAGSPLALRIRRSHCGCQPRDHALEDGAAADRAHRLVAAAHPPRQAAGQQHAGDRRRGARRRRRV